MTVNEAIYKVIRTQFKKDMGEALKIVEGEGYKVSKWDGRFYVKNETTLKEVCLRENYRGYTVCGNGYEKCRVTWNENFCRMDFVGYLNKPFNRDWYDLEAKRNDWRSATWYKYRRLLEAKNSIKYADTNIARLRNELATAQKNLELYVAERVRREQTLKNVRKDLGLN